MCLSNTDLLITALLEHYSRILDHSRTSVFLSSDPEPGNQAITDLQYARIQIRTFIGDLNFNLRYWHVVFI